MALVQQRLSTKRPSVSDDDTREVRRVKRQLSDRTITAQMFETGLHIASQNRTPHQPTASPKSPAADGLATTPRQLPQQKLHHANAAGACARQDGGGDTAERASPLPYERDDDSDFCLGDEVRDEVRDEALSEGQDECDGLGKQIKAVFHQVADGGSNVVKKFKDFLHHHHLHLDSHHQHHHDQDHQAVDDGFPVHLPGHFCNSAPIHLGARLRRAERGYRLTHILQDTLAYKLGLRVTDIITHLNDIELQKKDIAGILETFMTVEKTFTLTILREEREGDETRLIQKTLKVTITLDVVKKTLELEVVVFSSRVIYNLVYTSRDTYITQDLDDESEVYFNALSDGTVEMGSKSDEKGTFQLEFYEFFTDSTAQKEGQYCIIRNVSTGLAFDAVSGTMKELSELQTIAYEGDANLCFLLNKIKANDKSDYFVSMQEQDKCLANSSGKVTLKKMSKLSSYCFFKLFAK